MPSSPIVKDKYGTPTPINSLWQDRKIVIVFLRQLGCRFCRQQIDELNKSDIKRRLAEHDVHLVCISLGSPDKIQAWLDITKFQGEIYVDDSTSGDPTVDQKGSQAYGIFKLKRGVELLRLEDPEAAKKSEQVAKEFPDMVEIAEQSAGDLVIWPGDVFQTGGAFVFGPGNVCDFAFRSAYAGDHVDLSLVFKYAVGKDGEGKELVYESTENWFSLMKNDRKLTVSFTGSIVQQTTFHHLSNVVRKFFGTRTGVALGLGVFSFTATKALTRKSATSSVLVAASVSSFYTGFRALLSFALRPRVKYLDAQNDIVLLTPIDIDKKVLESGLPECDCGATMATMPMMGLREAGEVADKPKLVSRSRSETWSADLGQSNEFQSTLCYVREFLGKPHPAVGRGGPVCPFVPTSLKKNSIYMSVIRTNSLKNLQMDDKAGQVRKILVKLLKDFVPVFEKLEPSKGKLRQFKAVILIFPDIKPSEAHEIIDAVQVQAKEFFVERGLMCGEFHETNNASGLRNPNFFPLRTPLPCLAIRHMVPGDIAFMTLDDYPVQMRVKLLRGFLDVFGEDDKPQVKEAREKLEETLAEIANGKK
ncbi:hypothetical protein TrST_g6134 [Triparma strigata]|uniref:DUF6875 domain-containing protein n=1 Tax=Triparma strigata TaxID=1606541 RepID=A0A9W7B3I3_9STRA|nr:hypothetical protein TrST_g6134 [Triparma strigata]